MKEIRLQDIAGFQVGSAENEQAGTGCTVIICSQGRALWRGYPWRRTGEP